ncbi:hypothetical protein ACH4SP_23320 [Streptomyces sp. NPDC021093]|uniref:hypothetical protein n=1 Tax=Streptomyces sp. NPDC021093 TaxID=3365112 RepID=UPI0037B7A836
MRVTPVGVLVVVVALLVGGGTAWFLQRDQGKSPVVTASSSQPSPSASASPLPQDETETADGVGTDEPTVPSDRPTDPAAGTFDVVQDPSGITLAVPEGWQRSEDTPTVVFYRPPDEPKGRQGMHFVQFWPLQEENITSRDALLVTLTDNLRKPGFERIDLRDVPAEHFAEAAEMVYAYDSAEVGRRMQFVERVFRADDGQQYAFVVGAPANEWPYQYRVLTMTLRYFVPPGADTP